MYLLPVDKCVLFQEMMEAVVSLFHGSVTCLQLNCMPSCLLDSMLGLQFAIPAYNQSLKSM